MGKSEVQPSASPIRSILQVIILFPFTHDLPPLVLGFILCHIVEFGSDEEQDDYHIDNDQVSVSAAVFGRIVSAIDEGGADHAKLDGHFLFGQNGGVKEQRKEADILLYSAAATEREPTLFAFLEHQATRIGWQ